MNPEQARTLVQETFPQAFDKARYKHFVKELLNGFDDSKDAQMQVPDAFAEHVKSCWRLGTYESPDGELADILIVNTTEPWKLERTRTALRDFVAHKLKRGDSYKEAGLVAFVAPDASKWRFSFVRMEYESKRDPKTGKIAVEEQVTPARRFSYIVGENETCHTAQSRFLDLLQDTDNKPPLAKIEEAFSVEIVTKEFFGKYAELFDDINSALEKMVAKDKILRAEFMAKGVKTVDFAKKLMGQIVFLYFLQKKGWLGVEKGKDWGKGQHDFLRQLAKGKYGPYENFFNDVLEPLFYDTLATDRGHDAWCNRFKCRIPFLNGGLFEPLNDYDWKKTDILIPNRLFTNDDVVEESITGTGILDVFDRYNFTVNEAEPLEKEVAIDPEMLGKVFENLLEVKERKSKGSFYTPREIVHYMCQESLINYLDTAINTAEESLVPKKPKQAFLFAESENEQEVLTTRVRREVVSRSDLEILVREGEQISHYESVAANYKIKMPKSVIKNAKSLDAAIKEITVCDPAVGSGAFPVGMLTEIVRARRALTTYFNDVADRTSYQFKRHAIQNCLYGVDIDNGAVEIAKLRLWLSLVVDEDDVKQIKPLPNLDYRVVTGNSLMGFPFKSTRQQEIEKLKLKFFDEPDYDTKARLKKQIKEALDQCFAAAKKSLGYDVTFDFEVWFSEVFEAKGGFDVVIANPPYVRQEQIKELKPVLQGAFDCYTGIADLFVYFYERGVKLLSPGGTIALITSNKYYRAGYGTKLRGFLTRELTLQRLIDFGDAPVFQAIAYASILTGVRTSPAEDASVLAYTWEKEMTFERIQQSVSERGQQIRQVELKAEGWRLESPAVLRLLERLLRTGRPLGDHVNGKFYRGVVTGLNEAFVIDRTTRDQMLREDKRSAEVLKPFLLGRHVRRWTADFPDLYLCFIVWDLPIKEYPAVLNHLKKFETQLRARPEVRDGRFPWFALSRYGSDFWQEFETPKIIYPDIYEHQSFAWDESNSFLGNTVYFIPTKEKWLNGLLNSTTVEWLYSRISNKVRGGYLRAFSPYVQQIPIPAVPIGKQKPVERLVERILSAKQRDSEADVSSLEREIDELVYELYGLTPAEIKIVER